MRGEVSPPLNQEIRNTEYRNPKQIQITEIQKTKTNSKRGLRNVSDIWILHFELVSDFEIPVSDFCT